MRDLSPIYGVVYLITNKANGKVYVGQTIRCIADRFKSHLYASKTQNPSRRDFPLLSAIRKYGKESFEIGQICVCQNQTELDLMEDLYIVTYESMNPKKGYNLKRGGARGKASEQTKNKHRKRSSGKGNPRYLHNLKTEDIVKLYEEGYGSPKISSILGVSQSVVEKRLLAASVKMRSVGRGPLTDEEKKIVGARMKIRHSGNSNPAYRHDVKTEDLARLHSEGASYGELSKKFFISRTTVKRRIVNFKGI